MNFKKNIIFLLVLCTVIRVNAQKKEGILVRAGKADTEIASTMWGVFFEDINMGADGGIYAELVKNRSFEFAKPLMGWSVKGKKIAEGDVLVLNRQENQVANPRFLRLNVNAAMKGDVGIINEGFKGMGIKKGVRYDFSLMYRQQRSHVTLYVSLTDEQNNTIAETHFKLADTSGTWQKQGMSFDATDASGKAKLNIWFEGTGLLDLDMISLFPSDTWKGRKGGMRSDMIQMLADMKPGFIRFPGGCIVEGIDLANRYQWKKTIGPIEERQLIMNRWNVEFSHRPAPDYFQTFGLGFFEYFQLAEDLGAAPLPILNCGMACQFNTAEVVPLEQLDPYVQDALDLIEFANGDVTSEWGSVRAKMGHSKPFNLKYLGIGNENWGPQYVERAKVFQQAIKAKYPEIQLIYSSGTDPDSERFRYLNGELRAMDANVIDEHYYRSPDWFLKNAGRYDQYDRNGPKIFAGEYAAHVDGKITGSNRNIWQAAIAEAAFMTGLERNAAVVNMASYAPLFANTEGWQWAPDLIWADNLNVYGTPNYLVQKLFSTNKGTHTLSASIDNKSISGADQLYVSAVADRTKKEIIIKLVNTDTESKIREITLDSWKNIGSSGKLTVLKGNLTDRNSMENPALVSPQEQDIRLKGKTATVTLPPNSLVMLKVKYN
ncbi:alpha-L-arabinofuranosidase C-terminal domain-containing protein [Pedobacter metabolipauper]|uniref:non-reducing end alpha-L-arabinofuranosidase n=1 Tax=Pedobacter metabolipauper TaxID=425513 RepID=A0A4R6SX35_9SPHI|nr:alpha-L-arabinofuranosidase C-terminal domain-containing protein [Pedobacter metabolipauper]TDQ08911.1 alpha-L-arabinofuranosidase [Pedobacter metabolipauper]